RLSDGEELERRERASQAHHRGQSQQSVPDASNYRRAGRLTHTEYQVRNGQKHRINRDLREAGQNRQCKPYCSQAYVEFNSPDRVALKKEENQRKPDGCAQHGLMSLVSNHEAAADEKQAARESAVTR